MDKKHVVLYETVYPSQFSECPESGVDTSTPPGKRKYALFLYWGVNINKILINYINTMILSLILVHFFIIIVFFQ